MRKKSFFKKILSGLLATSMIVGTLLTSSLTINAGTTANDGNSGNNRKWELGGGKFSCPMVNSCIYRIVPLYVGDNISSADDDSTVTLSYKDNYYRYRSIALYTTEKESDAKCYAYLAPNVTAGNTIAAQVLNSDGSFDFSSIGLTASLPTHKFNINDTSYVSFSDSLNSTIIESDGSQNVLDIFDKYIEEMDSRRDSLSDLGKSRLDELINISGWGTDDFASGARYFAISLEVCTYGIEESSNSHFVVSYGDLLLGPGSDIYYPFEVFKKAAKDDALLTWSATFNDNNVTVVPEQRYGEATYFMALDKKTQNVEYTQALNITLSYDDELKSNTNTSDISKSWGTVTSAKNPDVNLTDTTYTDVLDDAYKNSLTSTSITLNDESTLNTSNESDSLKTLSGKSDYSGSDLNKYDVLKIAVDGDVNLSDLGNVDITSALSEVSAKTQTNAISGGFGNTYKLSFEGTTTVRSNVANKLSSLGYASSVSSYKSLSNTGTITNMKDLQSSALLSGKIEGTPSSTGVSDANGTIYASISYLGKDKQVTSKNAEVYINADVIVEVVKNTEDAKYSVSDTKSWGMTKKDNSFTYTLAWNANDYNLTDAEALTESILSSLGDTYVLRGSQGANTLATGFKNATGKSVLGVKYMSKDDTSIEVGSTADADGTLEGVNTLVVNVSYSLPVNVKSDDYVDSNELNYIYSDLRGYKSSVNAIVPMGREFANDINYNYSVLDRLDGDNWSFGGTRFHWYYPVTGLFGRASDSIKSFGETSYPSYAYNLSRGLWRDSLVASSYRGLSAMDESISNDIITNLGLSVGAVGVLSSISAGENVDGTVSTKKSDTYKFTGTFNSNDENSVTMINQYKITHSLNKYTCAALDTASNEGVNKSGFTIQNNVDITNKITMVTQSSKTLTVYPEVAYKYYQSNVLDGVLNEVKPLTVYVMGERARTMQPSSLRGIGMNYNFGSSVADGNVISDGVSVGSEASAMSDGKQVLASGTTITMSANHSVDYRLISYSLDVVDNYNGVSVRNEFSGSNAEYDPASDHESYVQSFIDNVDVNTYMVIGNKEYEMKTSNTTPVVKNATATTSINIKFKDGVIDSDSKNSIINDMATEYSITTEEATQMFESAGFEKQLQAMFENNNDSFNNSKNRWYDEESVTLCVRKYVTVVDLKQVLVQDKIDYDAVGALGQNADGTTKNRTLDGVFKMSVSLPEDFSSVNLAGANILYEKQTIKGTEFKVTSASTNDWVH